MQLPELLLPHWLILAGSAFVLLGALGLLLFRPKATDETAVREAPLRTTNRPPG
jgi:hypothetical protein